MKLLSEQIRDLVGKSSTSSFAIARAAGIDKSAMSRFMNGGKLTMDKLDQLAEVLGLIVSCEISKVPRHLAKGRPPKKVNAMSETTELVYFKSEAEKKAFANELAI